MSRSEKWKRWITQAWAFTPLPRHRHCSPSCTGLAGAVPTPPFVFCSMNGARARPQTYSQRAIYIACCPLSFNHQQPVVWFPSLVDGCRVRHKQTVVSRRGCYWRCYCSPVKWINAASRAMCLLVFDSARTWPVFHRHPAREQTRPSATHLCLSSWFTAFELKHKLIDSSIYYLWRRWSRWEMRRKEGKRGKRERREREDVLYWTDALIAVSSHKIKW